MSVITLAKNSNGDAYKPQLNAKPGDIIELEGHYRLIFLDNINGTAENPIVIRNKGLVTVSGYPSYCFNIAGSHFKIDGTNDSAYKYGIVISGFDDRFAASAIGLMTSSNYEITGVEIKQVSAGFLQNPIAQSDMENIYIHHNYIHDLNNPNNLGRSEGFYFGNTGSVSPGKFRNCRIEENILENLSGDGIQVNQGDFIVKNNTVIKSGQAHLSSQRTGISIGGESTSIIEGNILDGCGGVAFLNMAAGGKHTFKNNTIKNVDVSALTNESIVYLSGRAPGWAVDFSNNIFENNKPNSKIIFNATADANTTGCTFSANQGVSKDEVKLNVKDAWIDYVKPQPIPIPAPIDKKVLMTIIIYTDGTIERS